MAETLGKPVKKHPETHIPFNLDYPSNFTLCLLAAFQSNTKCTAPENRCRSTPSEQGHSGFSKYLASSQPSLQSIVLVWMVTVQGFLIVFYFFVSLSCSRHESCFPHLNASSLKTRTLLPLNVIWKVFGMSSALSYAHINDRHRYALPLNPNWAKKIFFHKGLQAERGARW